ncbi:MAG: rubredoxin [Leeuwenhoekiella sp.]
MRKQLSRKLLKGGVLSPAELKAVVQQVSAMGLNSISLGSRQDILFKIPDDVSREPLDSDIVIPGKEKSENIVSSYLASDIFQATPWLKADRYLYILEQFQFKPILKINITDPQQRLVPLFTGHLNFIASGHEDYWYLYIRLPEWDNTKMFPALIYSWDISKISKAIQGILKEEPETVEMIFELLIGNLDLNSRTVDKPLEIPFYPFPYYEGMNRIGDSHYWLGLYWRNNSYDTQFLEEMCDLCATCRIGKISITPWKSLIIKGIPSEYKLVWEKFLGKFGINIRHSMLELNWHLPVCDAEALELKQYLVNNFDKKDISTYGLTFSITNCIRKAYYFTSIVIEKNKPLVVDEHVQLRSTYNLLYAKNFDPNTRKYIVHVQDVDHTQLTDLLIELSQMYFDRLGTTSEVEAKALKAVLKVDEKVYQCPDCQTIYDAEFGDSDQGIDPGTLFEDLPENYVCSLCDTPKAQFEELVVQKQVK